MTIWIVSDTHFGHENIIGYCGRPFASAAEMDEAMVERWNAVVKSRWCDQRDARARFRPRPQEPQAMPPIEVGDVVTQMGHGRPVAAVVEHIDDHLLMVRHLAHSETIHCKRVLTIYKPVWTREPRR